MLTDVDFFIKQRMVTIIELGRYVIIKFSTVALFNKGVMIGGKPYVSCIGKDFDEKSCTGYYIFFLEESTKYAIQHLKNCGQNNIIHYIRKTCFVNKPPLKIAGCFSFLKFIMLLLYTYISYI